MPVSSTATIIPSPLNGDESAPTALTPQAVSEAGGVLSVVTGAISFIGKTGATAAISLFLAITAALGAVISSYSIFTVSTP